MNATLLKPDPLKGIVAILLCCLCLLPSVVVAATPSALTKSETYRGPIDLVHLPLLNVCVTVNELSGTVSLVDMNTSNVLDEIAVGEQPGDICALGPTHVLVSCRGSGELKRLSIAQGRINVDAELDLGRSPLGIAANPHTAYVGLQDTGAVAEVDLDSFTHVRDISVGKWPRYLALSPDGSRIAVGLAGQSEIAVVDTATGEVLYREPLSGGINLGHMRVSKDGTEVYFPWMIYRSNPINVRNIQRGWVLASRLAKIRMDGPQYRRAISLDVPRKAVADPFGLDLSSDESRICVSSSGTHELLVYRLPDLPFIGAGGPGDLIDPSLLRDRDLFHRVPVGGRPMGLCYSPDDRHVMVANYLRNSVQLVNLGQAEVVEEIALGPTPQGQKEQLVHSGRTIFYDAARSLDQWYSCHSCHIDGGTNAKAMDTWNDGTELTEKTVLSLRNVTKTGPWTWHGWQTDLKASLQNSFTSTMQGESASAQDLEALMAFLETLADDDPPADSAPTAEGERFLAGKQLFESESCGCTTCHSGPLLTDGQVHDVGFNRDTDKYHGYNTPSLLGVGDKVRWLHDGRATSLEAVLNRWHRADEIGGGAELTEQEIRDLVAYLQEL